VRKKRPIKIQIVILFAAVSVMPLLQATTLARLSLDQLASSADNVARVRCVRAESQRENGAIWTVTTFNVIETMKGNLPAQVTVRLPGGRFGHFTETVDGTPKFNSGEEVIVFLERSQSGDFSVAGWVQGTFRIARDPHTLRETVTQDSSGFAVFDTATRSFRAEGIRQMPVEQFRARIAGATARRQETTR
jgi:hypothetical protein